MNGALEGSKLTQCADDVLDQCSTPTVCTSLLTAYSWDPVLAPMVQHPSMVPHKERSADSTESKVNSFFPSRKARAQNLEGVKEDPEELNSQKFESNWASTVKKRKKSIP
jgi:hypothetical protein